MSIVIDQYVFEPELYQICFGLHRIQLTPTEYRIAHAVAIATKNGDGITPAELYPIIHRHPCPPGRDALDSFTAHFTHICHKMQPIGVSRVIYRNGKKYCFQLNPPLSAPQAIEAFLLHNVVEILGVVDANGKVAYITPSVKDILGYPPEQFIGKSFIDSNYTMNEDAIKHRDELFKKRPRVARLVYQLQRADKTMIWADIFVHWLHPDDPNDPTYTFSIRNVDAWMELTGGVIPNFGFQPAPNGGTDGLTSQ